MKTLLRSCCDWSCPYAVVDCKMVVSRPSGQSAKVIQHLVRVRNYVSTVTLGLLAEVT